MTGVTNSQAAKQAFHNLSGDDVAKLKALNARVQNHTGKWGVRKGGEKTDSGAIQMPWVQNDPLIYELIEFMDTKGLLMVFNWAEWDEGSRLFESEDPTKYNNIDLETALKLISATIRKERFADGTLAWAFESGGFQELISYLASLRCNLHGIIKPTKKMREQA